MNEFDFMAVAGFMVINMLVYSLVFISLRNATHKSLRLEKALHDLENTVRALTTGSVGLGERLVTLEQRTRVMSKRQDDIDLREASTSYDQAIQLANKGSDTEKLVSTCGMSRGEAQLIVNLQKYNKAS